MNESTYTELIAAYLDHSLSPEEKARFDKLVEENKIDILEVREMQSVYQSMGSLPVDEPPKDVRDSFYAMLEAEKEKAQPASNPVLDWLNSLMTARKAFQLGFAVCLLLVGMLIGNLFTPFQNYRSQMSKLTSEVSQMKKVMALSLLDAPSSTARLKAVNISSEIVSANDQILKALFKTLNNDPNVNVRLASIDALLNHAQNPTVRAGLIQSIAKQESPQVQVALANAMLALQETDSIDELKQLLKKKDLQPVVRKKLNSTIETLTL